MNNSMVESTRLGIGEPLLNRIQKTKFCVVGCGGVGSNFSEMLIRTGATQISLIDGEDIEERNLNRTQFTLKDVKKNKTDVLAARLRSINDKAYIQSKKRHFGCRIEGDQERQAIRDLVCDSDITIITVDKNSSRIECEKLLIEMDKKYLVIGVEINQKEHRAEYACGWKHRTPADKRYQEGYGNNNGSYMSVVLEATCVGFNMLLHHLKDPRSEKFTFISRKYKDYIPENSSSTSKNDKRLCLKAVAHKLNRIFGSYK